MNASRLLAGLSDDSVDYARHCTVHGPATHMTGAEVRDQLNAAAGTGGMLRGRGGGAFPLARKIEAASRRRTRSILVVNGCEGEPMSGKDRVLLRSVPHLAIDGMRAVADAIAADQIIIALDQFDSRSTQSVHDALAERPAGEARAATDIVHVPPGYVTGQETALVNWINSGDARPTVAWPRVTERGVSGRPTLVSNAETLAHVGLITRHGTRWYSQLGTPEDPGTTLVTLSGAVVSPGVYEIEHGLPLRGLLRQAGGPSQRIAGVLIGGYAGAWIGPDQIRDVCLDRDSLHRAGTRLGAGIVVVLGVDACPVAETARVADWMALHSAGQCGPCVHGLAAIADALDDVCRGRDGRALADIARWTGQIPGRGACAHPDGAVSVISSALRVFRASFIDHAEHGPCEACDRTPVLQTPGLGRVAS